jgi:hypothetical protein
MQTQTRPSVLDGGEQVDLELRAKRPDDPVVRVDRANLDVDGQ